MSDPTQPSDFPDWTDGDVSKVTQPPSDFALAGWLGSQAPPFQYMNWLFYDIGLWIRWLNFITEGNVATSTVTTTTTGAKPVKTYLCNPTGGAFTFTLPAAAGYGGWPFTLKNIELGAGNNVTVGRTGSDLLEGGTSATLAPGDVQVWQSDGVSNWYLMNP